MRRNENVLLCQRGKKICCTVKCTCVCVAGKKCCTCSYIHSTKIKYDEHFSLYLFPVVVSALFFVRGARERERKKTTQLRNVCFFFEIAWRFEYRNNIQHFTLAYKMYIEHCTCHFIQKRKSLSNERMEKFGFDLTLWFVICLACDRFMCKFAGEHIFLFTHASH